MIREENILHCLQKLTLSDRSDRVGIVATSNHCSTAHVNATELERVWIGTSYVASSERMHVVCQTVGKEVEAAR